MEVLKADQNIGKNLFFWMQNFDTKFKEYFKSNPAQAQYLVEREKRCWTQNIKSITLWSSQVFSQQSEGKLKYEMEANKVSFAYVAALYSTIKDSEVKWLMLRLWITWKNEKKFKADSRSRICFDWG
jgi:peptidyl-prolyl cis-trans isomerase D